MNALTEIMEAPLLDVRQLVTVIPTRRGVLKGVDKVDIQIRRGERVGLVGESGCGKSMTARSILRLLPGQAAHIASGKVMFDGLDLVGLGQDEIAAVRGRDIAMVFQDPLSYLNPRMRIGDQIAEAVRLHQRKADVPGEVIAALESVGLPGTREYQRRYPHELSGGMRQRVMIAIALACRPRLLIADEPTTALDVTMQAQILALLERLCDERGLALMLITHDLGVVAGMCDRVYVMYAGQVVESGETRALFERPQHPYTRALLRSTLRIDERAPRFETIDGSVPDLVDPPAGCRFRDRCDQAMPVCTSNPPVKLNAMSTVRCWL